MEKAIQKREKVTVEQDVDYLVRTCDVCGASKTIKKSDLYSGYERMPVIQGSLSGRKEVCSPKCFLEASYKNQQHTIIIGQLNIGILITFLSNLKPTTSSYDAIKEAEKMPDDINKKFQY